MAIRNQLRLLLVAGSLLTASLAKPVERPFDDSDDDTPLPVLIWHGKRTIFHRV
jgi:palmitoyl-protein thioesterase